ncbi:MAG: hypothetical protein ABI833_08200 [Acidobacteriota bacterium]
MIDEIIREAELSSEAPKRASSRLKSRILSTLVSLQQAEGSLRILSESRDHGEQLCVFEHAVAILPSEELQSRNPCAVCHARLLAEHVENAPIYWPGCPYARFCEHP